VANNIVGGVLNMDNELEITCCDCGKKEIVDYKKHFGYENNHKFIEFKGTKEEALAASYQHLCGVCWNTFD